MQPHEPQPQQPVAIEQLVAFVLGETDAPTTLAIEKALQTDRSVAQKLASLRKMHESLGHLRATEASFAVSAEQHARLVAIMPSAKHDWLASLMARAGEVAMLVFDSLRGSPIAGYRSLETDGARLLRYGCLGGVMSLRVEADVVTRELMITGQFSGAGAMRTLRLLQHATGSEIARATLADDGYFECNAPAGVYAVELLAQSGESAVIPRVELGVNTSSP